jgi:Clp amino terminal domain, pathogenicity island component
VVRDDEPVGPYLEAIQRAFQFAHEHGRRCGPTEFLVGVSAGHEPAAAALDPGSGRSLREFAVEVSGPPGKGAGYLHMQAQEAATSLAAARGQWADPEHLLIALLDQGTPEVVGLLSRAGLDPAAVRRAALAAIGAPADLPPIPLPEPTPAGTLDRPPLPIDHLDSRAWAVLRWRQDHLPLRRLHRAGDLQALSHLERAAAWRLADRLGLDDDQRYSLIRQHDDQVGQRAARARSDLARSTGPTSGPHHPRPARATPGRQRARPARATAVLRRRHRFFRATVGWAAWFGNRGVGLRDRWFRLRTTRDYRGCPQP